MTTFPTRDEIVATRVAQGMGPTAASIPPAASQPTTGELIRERAAEDARELDHFVQAIAEHFNCQSLLSDEVRIKLRAVFIELRSLARRFDAEATRRGAPIGEPADTLADPKIRRDGGGRFVRRG